MSCNSTLVSSNPPLVYSSRIYCKIHKEIFWRKSVLREETFVSLVSSDCIHDLEEELRSQAWESSSLLSPFQWHHHNFYLVCVSHQHLFPCRFWVTRVDQSRREKWNKIACLHCFARIEMRVHFIDSERERERESLVIHMQIYDALSDCLSLFFSMLKVFTITRLAVNNKPVYSISDIILIWCSSWEVSFTACSFNSFWSFSRICTGNSLNILSIDSRALS